MRALLTTFCAGLLAVALAAAATPAASQSHGPVYAMYYLWWSGQHWHDKLGQDYPYRQSPGPLPATLDSTDCNPGSLYSGNQLVDAPVSIDAYDQDQPGVIETDVRNAANAGLSGFIANWIGTGDANQSVRSTSYSRRLQTLVDVVHKVNDEGIPFKLWISLKTSATIVPDAQISGDLAYLDREYTGDPAFDHTFSPRLMLIWQGSRKYDLGHIQAISQQWRGSFFLIGDETYKTWGIDSRTNYLDGGSWYWSTQNPYENPASFGYVEQLANMVRSGPSNPDGTRKLWFAPFAPGYDSILLGTGSTCITRYAADGTSTLATLYNGNLRSNPDGWTLISWNEIAEGSFIVPLQRWGFRELVALSHLIGGSL